MLTCDPLVAHERRLDAEFDRVLGYLDIQFYRMSCICSFHLVALLWLIALTLQHRK